INDFFSQKGIKREFSNARTPQQNGVVERRNRTLIEAARTMLADAKLPVTFSAEAVNTACYVQNRVLINKSQNKTPYELFNGKFEAKGDEGYFIGYSMSSKAFRVFNKRTRRVEENLHVEFLENKAIEKGSGPNWLFDIDSLTKSMNYVPVDAESSSSKPQDDCSTDVPKSSGNSNPTATSTNPPADQLETVTVETPIPTVSLSILIACFTESLEPSSKARIILKRVANQVETPSMDNILTLVNRFEYILRVTTNSNEPNGVEADVTNMETTITASPTPTLRIHKDHSKSQITGHVDTLIQTRNKSKEVLKNKKDERGIVIRNKARLVAQGNTHEERIDYDEVFAPVARTEAIRLFLAYASFMGFTVYQMDVKSAFLYGTIDEEVYMMQPPGFQDPDFPAKVYKVENAMYGLHQAPRAWYVYVDDIIFGSSNPQLCREFEALMHEKFKMSVMGDILKKFGYSNVRSSNTPMDKENPCGKDRTRKDEEGIDYDEVFSPVVRIEAIILFLAYASFMGFIVYQMDVKSSSFYGTINEEVYVMQPLGF
nr:hypothetical protein [Tanacetum cinerariifolium]